MKSALDGQSAVRGVRAALAGSPAVRRAAALVLGALFVALAAQVAVPLPFTPVPMTLQPLAVLIVGGLLGPAAGAAALALYVALGALGLPVFTPIGPPGAARLLGPTGGYLLSYPAAAAVTGWLADRPSVRPSGRLLLACAAGMLVIHLGGSAQLAILGGDPGLALRLGVVPFLTGDLVKIGLAALVIRLVRPRMPAPL
ncbi:MAG TPA: biotin transporter BioY [Gemmatimonadales bacterium]|nr:biotin transporter BioY [Gemmatimonadales bacterium]